MDVFRDTDNKQLVRRQWNLPVIHATSIAFGKKLSYLGLPGADINDLVDWREYLDRLRTGVERNRNGLVGETDRINQRRILSSVCARGEEFSSGFELRRGNIEDLIIGGVDGDGVKPQLGDGRIDGRFYYDLVNLDFCGGAGYADKKGQVKRIKAFQKLAERQQDKDFLLLVTFNVRDKMGTQIVDYLTSAQARYSRDTEFASMLKWYAGVGEGDQAYVLKASVPMFVQQEFEIFGFHIFAYPPLMYEGTGEGSRLVNFMFNARFVPGRSMLVTSEQNPDDLVRLPMMEIADGHIRLASKQHPMFDTSTCQGCLDFLEPDIRAEIRSACAVL
jgi:hypothetical protein